MQWPRPRVQLAAMALVTMSFFGSAIAAPVTVPFDFSRNSIAVDVSIRGTRLVAILDTGVNPSVVDAKRADELGLKVDHTNSGEASGFGDAKSAVIFPATIDGLTIAGHAFAPIDALTSDMKPISVAFGRQVDVVLGYSFLKDKVVLIDYERRGIEIDGRSGGTAPAAKSCQVHWDLPLQSFNDDPTPIIPNFRLGSSSGPATLDTGSNGAIMLFPRALELPGVRAALTQDGESVHTGARGTVRNKTFLLSKTTGFGPFSIPSGVSVDLGTPAGDADKRVGNIGNKFFAAMKLKILLDYPAKRITFYGNCTRH